MSKVRVLFACQACGLESSKWLGRCPDCGEWNSFVEERREEAPAARGRPAILAEGASSRPKPYDLIDGAEGARTPSGIDEFDRVLGGGVVPGSMVLIGGEPGIGKCLAGSTRLLDPETGALLPITEWARRQRHVVSLDESTQRLMSQPVASFHEQGVRPIVELKTRLGRTLRCTPGHPVLTPAGWKAAGDLRPGTRIASPRALPYFGADRMPDHEVKLVASGAAELERLAAAADLPVGTLLPTARSRAEMTTEAARFLTSLGLRFQTAGGKTVPDCIFRLPADQLRLFLKVLFSCDGSVYVSAGGQSGVSYSTVSERLARDVQHLLLRFGFVSKLRTKTQRVNGRPYVAYEVQLLGLREVKRFLREIGIWGREGAKADIGRQASPRGSSTHFDTVPTGEGFWGLLHAATGGAPFSRVSATAGVHLKNRRHERPLCRSTVAALASAYPSPELCRLAEADVYWDEIESVVPAGQERVYDLSMPSHANFVANDLIVHNSTLLLQVAHLLGRTHGTVLYVSAEESERQVKLRGERLGIHGGGLFLLAETSLERILDLVEELKPAALVVDSVQTVFSSRFPSAPGSISQVREVATQLLFVAKGKGITTFLIGHVTKDGSLAGPKSLEHIVDTVLYFEGEKRQHHRIVRAVKNRFGAVSEMGVFEMTGAGLKPVANPSALFLAERIAGSPGSAVVATMEGTRPMLAEVQALVSPTSFGTPRRMSLGIDPNRTNLLLAVLEKRVGLELLGDDVFVSVAGGLEVDEPAADLGVAAAIASSFRNRPVPGDTVLFGEVGLAGEVRGAAQAGLRIREAARMGFTRCILPARNVPSDADHGLRLVGVDTFGQALERLMDDAPSR